MRELKTYLRGLFRVLALVSALVTILVFTTGKSSLSEWSKSISSYFENTSSEKTTQPSSLPIEKSSISKSDNLVTTICKAFVVILAIISLMFAAFFAAILELIIWIVSFGDNSFYCTKKIWNLCWTEIFSAWFWDPAKSTYLWITFLLYSGFFGTKSVDKKKSSSLK
jgi:hypothetical protein